MEDAIMAFQLPDSGAASQDLIHNVHPWWQAAAGNSGIDLSGFNPVVSLKRRIVWALEQGLEIGTIYDRFSSKVRDSTSEQVRTCVQHAATRGFTALQSSRVSMKRNAGIDLGAPDWIECR